MSAAVAHNAGADSAVEGLIDLDTLQGELDSARGQVEMWCARRELSMKEQVAAHKTNMMEAEEQGRCAALDERAPAAAKGRRRPAAAASASPAQRDDGGPGGHGRSQKGREEAKA